jgi:hypothetical protein
MKREKDGNTHRNRRTIFYYEKTSDKWVKYAAYQKGDTAYGIK